MASDFALGAQRFRQDARGFGDLLVIGVASSVEQRPHLLVRKAVDQACFAEKRFSTPFDDLAQEPLKILLGLLVHRQRVHGILDRDRAQVLQSAPNLDAEICRLRRQLMNEQKPAVRQRPGCSSVHDIDTVSWHKFERSICIISILRVI
jgi:hypothetical protein